MPCPPDWSRADKNIHRDSLTAGLMSVSSRGTSFIMRAGTFSVIAPISLSTMRAEDIGLKQRLGSGTGCIDGDLAPEPGLDGLCPATSRLKALCAPGRAIRWAQRQANNISIKIVDGNDPGPQRPALRAPKPSALPRKPATAQRWRLAFAGLPFILDLIV